MKRRIARENAFIAAFEASFNANSIEAAMRIIAGTARSMGVTVAEA